MKSLEVRVIGKDVGRQYGSLVEHHQYTLEPNAT